MVLVAPLEQNCSRPEASRVMVCIVSQSWVPYAARPEPVVRSHTDAGALPYVCRSYVASGEKCTTWFYEHQSSRRCRNDNPPIKTDAHLKPSCIFAKRHVMYYCSGYPTPFVLNQWSGVIPTQGLSHMDAFSVGGAVLEILERSSFHLILAILETALSTASSANNICGILFHCSQHIVLS
jgi:hypothetical protein